MTSIEFTPGLTISGMPAPHNWHIIEARLDGNKWERLVGERITVIESIAMREDGRKWLHVSVAKPNRKKMPTYDDLQTMRKLFIGEDKEAYMVFPPRSRYVNINPVLHLWVCLDEIDGILPKFEGKVGSQLSI